MDEESLIREIIENPELEEPKLVYADWLEERGDPRAEFLRLQSEFDGFEFDHSAAVDLKSDLLEYWDAFDEAWLEQVSTKYDVWFLGDSFNELGLVRMLKLFSSFTLQSALGSIGEKGPRRILWGLSLPRAEASSKMIKSVTNVFPTSKLVAIVPNWREPPYRGE